MQLFRRKLVEPFIADATADDIAHIATIHADSFARPWSQSEIGKMLSSENTFCLVLKPKGKLDKPPLGFVICRKILDEAEILSIASSKNQRRSGIGRMLLDETIRKLHAERIKSLFLEVDENNGHAISLYRKSGFRLAGKREGYYRESVSHENDGSGNPASALVMHLALG